jgi:hypothetical protein
LGIVEILLEAGIGVFGAFITILEVDCESVGSDQSFNGAFDHFTVVGDVSDSLSDVERDGFVVVVGSGHIFGELKELHVVAIIGASLELVGPAIGCGSFQTGR